MAVENGFISESRKVLDNEVHKSHTVKIRGFDKIKELWIIVIFNDFSHFIYNTGSFWNEAKVLQPIKHIFSQKALCDLFQIFAFEEIGVTFEYLFQIPRHRVVLKLAGRVIWPKAEVHGVNDETVGRNLLNIVLFWVVEVPIAPFVVWNALLFHIFAQICYKLVNFTIIDAYHFWLIVNPEACISYFLARIL